jgi:alkyl sulfatase BDS1-like metallo-beta-lactamase superfamily hydrolase
VCHQPPWNLERFFTEELPLGLSGVGSAAGSLGGIFQIMVTAVCTWSIDLNAVPPRILQGTPSGIADITITLTEADLQSALSDPQTEGRRLLEEGRIEVEGDFQRLPDLLRILEFRRTVSSPVTAS